MRRILVIGTILIRSIILISNKHHPNVSILVYSLRKTRSILIIILIMSK